MNKPNVDKMDVSVSVPSSGSGSGSRQVSKDVAEGDGMGGSRPMTEAAFVPSEREAPSNSSGNGPGNLGPAEVDVQLEDVQPEDVQPEKLPWTPLGNMPGVDELPLVQIVKDCKAQLDESCSYLDEEERAKVDRAFVQAFICHYEDVRKSGEPYIIHPTLVANYLASYRMDANTICAGLLHDVVEDAKRDSARLAETLRERFGDEVAFIVDGCSKIKNMDMGMKGNDEFAKKSTVGKLLMCMVQNYKVIVVKIADRMHNMATLEHMKPEKRAEKSIETLRIYAPLAVRFGMDDIAKELQNMAFRYYSPFMERVLRRHLDLFRQEISEPCETMERRLRENLLAKNIRMIDFRINVKTPYRVYDKMRTKGVRFNQITNKVSITVVLESVDDCYAAMGVIHSLYRPNKGGINDYIHSPLSTGYQSLHTLVSLPDQSAVKIYIRTVDMDRRARRGILAFDVYETEKRDPMRIRNEVKVFFDSVRRVYEEANDPDEFFNMAMNTLDDRQIMVGDTATGEMKCVPVGATVLDFAYLVNKENASYCYGAWVNGLNVPLNHVVQHGDMVKLVLGAERQVEEVWLDMTTTRIAKKSIRTALRQIDDDVAIALGRENLLNFLKPEGDLDLEEAFDDLLGEYVEKGGEFATVDELLRAVGVQRYAPVTVAADIVNVIGQERGVALDRGVFTVWEANVGTICYEDRLRPIPGDVIKAVYSKNKTVMICRAESPTGDHSDQLVVEAKWGSLSENRRFKADVRVIAADVPGVLKKLVDVVSAEGCNICTCSTRPVNPAPDFTTHSDDETTPGDTQIDFCVDVVDLKEVQNLLSGFKCVPQVRRVMRV